VAKDFKDTWKIINVDFVENPDAHKNFILEADMRKNTDLINEEIAKLNIKFDSIFSLNGSFVPGKISEIDIFEKYDAMFQKNVTLSVLGYP
jgi:hypothetical protein